MFAENVRDPFSHQQNQESGHNHGPTFTREAETYPIIVVETYPIIVRLCL